MVVGLDEVKDTLSQDPLVPLLEIERNLFPRESQAFYVYVYTTIDSLQLIMELGVLLQLRH